VTNAFGGWAPPVPAIGKLQRSPDSDAIGGGALLLSEREGEGRGGGKGIEKGYGGSWIVSSLFNFWLRAWIPAWPSLL